MTISKQPLLPRTVAGRIQFIDDWIIRQFFSLAFLAHFLWHFFSPLTHWPPHPPACKYEKTGEKSLPKIIYSDKIIFFKKSTNFWHLPKKSHKNKFRKSLVGLQAWFRKRGREGAATTQSCFHNTGHFSLFSPLSQPSSPPPPIFMIDFITHSPSFSPFLAGGHCGIV